MKRRICMALALMIALTLSVCAIADEYENFDPAQEIEQEETPVISAGSVDDEVGVEEDADLDEEIEEEPEEESPEEEKDPEEQTVIEEQPDEEESEEKESEEQKPAAEEEPVEEEPTEEEPTEEEPTEEEPTEEEPAEGEPAEEEPDEEEPAEEPEGEPEEVVEAEPVEEQPEVEAPVANELTYSGEAQALVSAQGAWLYSMDGEHYGEDIPTAVDAGEYTVYYKAEADAEPETLTVTVAKADVTFIPPVAAFIEE